MANTFASHILEQAAAGLKHPSSAEPTPCRLSSRFSSRGRSQTTYASVILMMAVGTCASAAHAATDGQLAKGGASSSGSVTISLTIPERIAVDGLNRVDLSAEGSSGEVGGCVSGRGAGLYSLSVAGADTDSYDLGFAANDGAFQPLTMGQALERLGGAGSAGCADGLSNARLSVRQNTSAVSGTAGSAVTLMISPE